ncbi:putative ribonuclease H-like domain-containing protein [Tanacetum coccineum]
MAFVTTPGSSSTNNTANPTNDVSTGSSKVNTTSSSDLEQIHEDDLEVIDLKWQLSLLSMRAKRYYQRIGKKIFINANDTAGYDKSKVECFNCHKMGHFAKECRAPINKDGQFRYQDNTRKQGNNDDTSSKAMFAIDGIGFDWSDMAKEQVHTNMVLMAFSDSELNETEFKAATYKRGLATVEEQLVTFRKNEVLFSEEIGVLKREVACKDCELDKLLESQITDKSKKGLGYHVVAPPHPLSLNAPTKLDFSYSGLDEFKEPEFNGYDPRDTMLKSTIDCDNESENSKENTDDSLVKEQVSEDENSSIESPLNVVKETVFHAAKKVEFVKPKNNEKPVRKSVSYAEMYRSQSPRGNQRNWNGQKSNQLGSNFVMYNKACFVCGSFNHVQINCHHHQRKRTVTGNNYNRVNTVRPRVVNTARPYTSSVNTVRAKGVNDVKPSACWVLRPTRPNGASLGKPQMNDKGFVDSGCSRHMTGNMAYLSNFKEFDRGYVTFRGGAYGGRITGKGILKTDNLDFDDIYFVNELKFNLFSVSQMCDKKNYVIFTDTECLVLSPNFKLPDESQILLKIPRMDNMLGHINFKNINKLVKENIVRGLPEKRFENEQTCVACLKRKATQSLLREYSVARTPQHNGVAERRNMKLIEAARTMLADSKLPTTFWAEAVSTSCVHKEILMQVHLPITSQDCIVMPIWKDASYFDSPSKKVGNDDPKSIVDNPKQDEEGDLKSRGSIEDFVSFREMITSQLQGKLWLYDEVPVKRIFRYLKGKPPTIGPLVSRDSPVELVCIITDSDYAGETQDRKSTTGGWEAKLCITKQKKNDRKDMIHHQSGFKYIAKSKEVRTLMYLQSGAPLLAKTRLVMRHLCPIRSWVTEWKGLPLLLLA